MTVVAGTGHRPDKIKGKVDAIIASIDAFLDEVHPEKVISGMALGFDQLLAVSARDHGIPWVAAIPFPGQDKLWSDPEKEHYHRLLESASDIIIVSPSYVGPWVMQVRNKWMVDNCDMMVACWDGSPGGTGNCLKYANKIARPVRYLQWN